MLCTCGDLKSQEVQVLLIGGLKGLAHVFGKLMILKNAHLRDEGSGRMGFQSHGKLEVREIDVSDPDPRMSGDALPG